MTLEFFQSPDLAAQTGTWKTIIGLLIVLFASLVGVEIKLGNDDDDDHDDD